MAPVFLKKKRGPVSKALFIVLFFMFAVSAFLLASRALALKNASDSVKIAEYRLNGMSILIKESVSERDPGDYIGMQMHKAKEACLEVQDGSFARDMARVFMGDAAFDCALAFDPASKTGMLYIAAEDKTGSRIKEVTLPEFNLDLLQGDKTRWHKDGTAPFPGSEWVMSIEIVYMNGSANYSNFYYTKRTDMAAIRTHYINDLAKKGYTVLNEQKSGEGEWIFLTIKEGVTMILAIKRSGNGRFTVSTLG